MSTKYFSHIKFGKMCHQQRILPATEEGWRQKGQGQSLLKCNTGKWGKSSWLIVAAKRAFYWWVLLVVERMMKRLRLYLLIRIWKKNEQHEKKNVSNRILIFSGFLFHIFKNHHLIYGFCWFLYKNNFLGDFLRLKFRF